MPIYRTKQPGDILHLSRDLPECDGGDYVLLSIGDSCCLAQLGVNEEGNMVATSTHVQVSIADLSLFEMTWLALEPI